MAINTMLRAVIPVAVADRATARAETEGKTLADAVVDLLADYGKAKPRKKVAKKS